MAGVMHFAENSACRSPKLKSRLLQPLFSDVAARISDPKSLFRSQTDFFILNRSIAQLIEASRFDPEAFRSLVFTSALRSIHFWKFEALNGFKMANPKMFEEVVGFRNEFGQTVAMFAALSGHVPVPSLTFFLPFTSF